VTAVVTDEKALGSTVENLQDGRHLVHRERRAKYTNLAPGFEPEAVTGGETTPQVASLCLEIGPLAPVERHRDRPFPFHKQAGESPLGVASRPAHGIGPAGGGGGGRPLGSLETLDAGLAEQREPVHRPLPT